MGNHSLYPGIKRKAIKPSCVFHYSWVLGSPPPRPSEEKNPPNGDPRQGSLLSAECFFSCGSVSEPYVGVRFPHSPVLPGDISTAAPGHNRVLGGGEERGDGGVKESISWASGAQWTEELLGPGNHLSHSQGCYPATASSRLICQAPAQTQWSGRCWCSSEAHLSQDRVFLRTWQTLEIQRVQKGEEGREHHRWAAMPGLQRSSPLAELHDQMSCSHEIPPPGVKGC